MHGGEQKQSSSVILTEEEEDTLSVVIEDELQLQQDEENHLRLAILFVSLSFNIVHLCRWLRGEIKKLEQKSNDYTDSCCSCCGVQFGMIINRGASCPICTKRVCKQHRSYDLHGNSWNCTLCDMRM